MQYPNHTLSNFKNIL